DVVQLELRREAIRAIRSHLADGDEVALEITPVLKADLIAGAGPIDHVLAVQRREAPTALQVGRNDLRHIKRRGAGGFPAERHHGDWNRVLLPARDLDHELGVRGDTRDSQHQAKRYPT